MSDLEQEEPLQPMEGVAPVDSGEETKSKIKSSKTEKKTMHELLWYEKRPARLLPIIASLVSFQA